MRIAFTGSFGVGKSTMSRWLAEKLGYTLIPDIARELRILGLYPDRNGKKVEHYMYTLWKQIRLENINECFVSDGCLYGTAVYAVNDSVECSWEVEYAALKYGRYDRIFYLAPEIPLRKDSIRTDNQQYRLDIDERLRLLLDMNNIEYITVSGDIKKRQRKVLNYIPKGK
jgi:nicotinamide riboside kinase